jgi:hypothetical protein
VGGCSAESMTCSAEHVCAWSCRSVCWSTDHHEMSAMAWLAVSKVVLAV